jgi:hypothetical protein
MKIRREAATKDDESALAQQHQAAIVAGLARIRVAGEAVTSRKTGAAQD